MPRQPNFDIHTVFWKSDCAEAERTLRWLNGYDMSNEDKWIVEEKQIPCAWYAIEILAKQNGIRCRSKHAFQSPYDGRHHGFVIAEKGHGKFARSQIGAGSWNDKRLALCFAYRNAIRGLLPMNPNAAEQAAYRTTQKNAIRKYA